MKHFIITIALLTAGLSFAQAQASDTVWTKNLGTDVYLVEFVQNGEYILSTVGNIGANIYKFRTADGEKVNDFFIPGASFSVFSDDQRVIIPGFKIYDLQTCKVIDSFSVYNDSLIYHNGDKSLPYK